MREPKLFGEQHLEDIPNICPAVVARLLHLSCVMMTGVLGIWIIRVDYVSIVLGCQTASVWRKPELRSTLADT